MRRQVGALAVAALVAGLVVSIGPVASSHDITSRISIGVSDHSVRRHQSVFIYGDLKTPGHRHCHRFANVYLIRRHLGVIAQTTTDRQGNYVFKIDPKPNHGHFRTDYPGSGSFGYQGAHSCSVAKSRLIRIHRA